MESSNSQSIPQALPIPQTLPNNLMEINNKEDFKKIFGMSQLEKNICIFLIIFSTIYFNAVNILLFKKRKNYIIKHRGMILTLPSAVASYISAMNLLLNEIAYSMEFHNFYIYVNNILIVFIIMSACGRAIRLILLYNLNTFKSECILQIQDFNEHPLKTKISKVEVNTYMKAVDNMVKRKTGKWLLIISFVITIIITALMEYIKSFKSSNYDIVKFAEFAPINIFLILFTFLSVYFIYALRKIKDNETFGIKFEVHCSFIVSFIVFIFSIVMYHPKIDVPWLIEYTHSGSYLYIMQTSIGHFISATVPLILSYIEEKKFKKQSKILSSAEFSKLLYQKSVIDDLKVIAINDFCVENILFWESYIKIKELTYQCLTNTGIFEEDKFTIKEENIKAINKGLNDLYSNSQRTRKYVDKKIIQMERAKKPYHQNHYEFDFYRKNNNNNNNNNNNINNTNNSFQKNEDSFYTPRITSPTNQTNKNYFTPDDYKNYDIDPNIPLDSRLVPYYISFYKAFIDPYGPVNVNISSDIAASIFKNLFNNPTVGVFDEAKNDVITSMFLTLYPHYYILYFKK